MPPCAVSPAEAGQRLDQVLGRLVPSLGLRGRRRLCGEGRVLVNGRPGRAAYRLRPGDVLSLAGPRPSGEAGTGVPPLRIPGQAPIPMLGQTEHLAALDKPAGLHSEALAGKAGDSLQARVETAFPGAGLRLLNRLDYATSGLVALALDAEGVHLWRQAQDQGLTEKRYLALLEGELPGERLMRQGLSLKGRHRVRVEAADNADFRRHTLLRPLAALDARELADSLEAAEGRVWRRGAPHRITLAACRIVRGSRHQIRAHAAAAGFPLWGDRRYGAAWLCGKEPREGAESAGLNAEDECFYLHHGRLSLPGWTVWSAPRWLELLDEAARAAALGWLLG
ncbi:MAG: pseudouridine synthase [Desulfovibrionaceae bacterium]|nr:pseudouridine synthase [Desulfovibrionaceae bacterium]